jgi:hypothetical protein
MSISYSPLVLFNGLPAEVTLVLGTLLALGVGISLLCSHRRSKKRINQPLSVAASLTRSASLPVNFVPAGPLGFGLLPAMREKIKSSFLSAYLSRMYIAEISSFGNEPILANSAVAHASDDEAMNTMNIAMPELSAEYWCTFIPVGQAPVFRLLFPKWAVFSSLTAYDTSGLPLAAVHANQVSSDSRAIHIEGKLMVNLMLGVTWSGPICIVFRVYRPPSGPDMCPPQERPEVKLIPKGWVEGEQTRLEREARGLDAPRLVSVFDLGGSDAVGFMPEGMFDEAPECETKGYLPQASTEQALQAGRRFGKDFSAVISSKLKALGPDKFGSQFFHPKSVAGLFVNHSATYVVAFLPDLVPNGGSSSGSSDGGSDGGGHGKGGEAVAEKARGMRLRGRVPRLEKWRPFFGAMAVSYSTTETVSSLVDSQLGGWDSEFVLFVAHTEEEARLFGGYDPDTEPTHRLLLWKRCASPGLVMRFLHTEDASGLTQAEVVAALDEKRRLVELDGTRTQLSKSQVPGIAKIEYF